MDIQKVSLSLPTLEELAAILREPLKDNYQDAQVSVLQCPDLRQAPFYYLTTEGLSSSKRYTDVSRQLNLFPHPQLDNKWSIIDLAKAIEIEAEKGGLLGASARPFYIVG
jgi:hypothetical protein